MRALFSPVVPRPPIRGCPRHAARANNPDSRAHAPRRARAAKCAQSVVAHQNESRWAYSSAYPQPGRPPRKERAHVTLTQRHRRARAHPRRTSGARSHLAHPDRALCAYRHLGRPWRALGASCCWHHRCVLGFRGVCPRTPAVARPARETRRHHVTPATARPAPLLCTTLDPRPQAKERTWQPRNQRRY